MDQIMIHHRTAMCRQMIGFLVDKEQSLSRKNKMHLDILMKMLRAHDEVTMPDRFRHPKPRDSFFKHQLQS